MKLQQLFIFVCCIIIVKISASRHYADDDDENSNEDEEINQLKRFLFHKPSTPKTSSVPSVIENLIRPSTRPPIPWTYSSTYSPWKPSSGACSPNPCQHNGLCYPTGQLTFECKCPAGWRGIYCGIADACYRSPCRNGGTCLNVLDDYWCACPAEYYGTDCENKFSSSSNPVNYCRPNICNNGQCMSLSTTYYCQCPKDRYGNNCEKIFPKRNSFDEDSLVKLLDQVKRDEADDSSDSSESNGDK